MAKPVDLVIRVKADTGEVAPGMKALDNQLDQATKSAKALDKELGDVTKHDVDIDVNTQAIKAARDRIDDLRDDIAKMKTVDIDADTKAAEQEIAKLKRSIKALSEDAGGGSIGHNISAGLDTASEGLDEFKGEADGTAREVAASFDGSIESIAGGFQELAANAFAGFGPAGQVAGLAAAAGIGIAVGALQGVADAANAVTQEAAEWAQVFGEADQTGRVEALGERFDEFGTAVQRATNWYDVLLDKDLSRPETNIENIAAAAKIGAINAKAFYDAFNQTDARKRLKELEDVLGGSERKLRELREVADSSFTKLPEDIDENIESIVEFQDALEQEMATARAAIAIEEAMAAAKNQSVEEYRRAQDAIEAQERAVEDAKAAQEDYNQLIEESANPVTVFADILSEKTEQMRADAQAHADSTKEATGQAADSWEDYATTVTVTTQDMIDEWNRQAAETTKFEENLAKIGAAGGQALADELRAKGPEVAGAAAEALATAPTDQQQAAIDAHMKAQGAAAAAAAAQGAVESAEKFRAQIRALFNPGGPYAPGVSVGPPPPGWTGHSVGGQSVASAVAPGNVRVYIDGNQLRATVRTDVSAAAARAALVGTGGRSRP